MGCALSSFFATRIHAAGRNETHNTPFSHSTFTSFFCLFRDSTEKSTTKANWTFQRQWSEKKDLPSETFNENMITTRTARTRNKVAEPEVKGNGTI